MKHQSYSIDVAMLTKKYYCHKCGERLVRSPRSRLITRGDPDYRKHSRIGHHHYFGDIELTEYDFKCCNCDRIIHPDDQYIIERIQKTLGKHILSDREFNENNRTARLAIERKAKITDIIVKVIFILGFVIACYFGIKTGNFSGKIYF